MAKGIFPNSVWSSLFPKGLWPEFAGLSIVSDPDIIQVKPSARMRYGDIPRARLAIMRGYGNAGQYVFRNSGETVDFTLLSRVRIVMGDQVIDSALSPSAFDLTQVVTAAEASRNSLVRQSESKLVLRLGLLDIPAGTYTAPVILYDEANPAGFFWGIFDAVSMNVSGVG